MPWHFMGAFERPRVVGKHDVREIVVDMLIEDIFAFTACKGAGMEVHRLLMRHPSVAPLLRMMKIV